MLPFLLLFLEILDPISASTPPSFHPFFFLLLGSAYPLPLDAVVEVIEGVVGQVLQLYLEDR